MPCGIISSLCGVAAHNGYQFAIRNFVIGLSAFFFGHIAATDDTPINILHQYYFNIASILESSSDENLILSRHFSESASCSGLLAPIRTEVTRSSFNSHDNDICASVCPRCRAISFSFFIWLMRSSVTWLFCRKPVDFAALESSGIPCRYLLVNSPCANGENGMQP